MSDEVRLHLERAVNLIQAAEQLRSTGFHADSVSRSYYAMFHAATALLLRLGIERSSHRGVVAAFGEHVAKARLLDAKYHSFLREAFEARNESDYLPLPAEDEVESSRFVGRAREFVEACQKLVATGLTPPGPGGGAG